MLILFKFYFVKHPLMYNNLNYGLPVCGNGCTQRSRLSDVYGHGNGGCTPARVGGHDDQVEISARAVAGSRYVDDG